MFFPTVYETRRIIGAFGKFRSILLNTQDELVQYMINNKVSKRVNEGFKNEFSYINVQNNDYLHMIVHITMKFIKGQAVESMSTKFYNENLEVNASACEFLELVLKSLENYPQ
jgi:hypothetical protein